jgi:hypothetical protein
VVVIIWFSPLALHHLFALRHGVCRSASSQAVNKIGDDRHKSVTGFWAKRNPESRKFRVDQNRGAFGSPLIDASGLDGVVSRPS